MSIICLIDNSQHPDRDSLHKHLRRLKVKQEDYYTQYEPRRDLCTGEIIPFKAPVERYLTLEFASKTNLRKWIQADSNEARAWAINWLRKRRETKGLIYPPSQTELRSLMSPSARYYDHLGGYNALCKELGYTVRFQNDTIADNALPDDVTIIEDTREQRPLEIDGVRTIQQKLPYGDYTLAAPHDTGIYIERKSLNDFVGTLSDRTISRKSGDDSNLERFTRELERAQETGGYVIMLVESDINDALSFNYLPQFTRRFGRRFDTRTKRMVPCEYKGAMPEHVFKNLRDLLVRFPLSFQALFVKDREQAANAVVKLLAAGESVKTCDLELAYEAKKLTFDFAAALKGAML